jgi:hypothetical protein
MGKPAGEATDRNRCTLQGVGCIYSDHGAHLRVCRSVIATPHRHAEGDDKQARKPAPSARKKLNVRDSDLDPGRDRSLRRWDGARTNTGDRPLTPDFASPQLRRMIRVSAPTPRRDTAFHCCDRSVAAEPGRQPDPTAQDRATTLGPRLGGANEADFDRLVKTVVGTLG